MLRVARGDAAAFEPLVRLVLPRLLGYFRRLGADRALAEDCAQEVLVKVHRARDQYRPRARFVTYLFHIARNHWIDLYRHRRLGPRVSYQGSFETEGEGGIEPEARKGEADASSRALRGELAEALRHAIERLPEEHREVFVLAQVETLRYQEIAEILGIPVGTVKSRMHAAVRLLREDLRREGIEP
jgi:RNA polymerase sigma-70 factor (ECF subfamily)